MGYTSYVNSTDSIVLKRAAICFTKDSLFILMKGFLPMILPFILMKSFSEAPPFVLMIALLFTVMPTLLSTLMKDLSICFDETACIRACIKA